MNRLSYNPLRRVKHRRHRRRHRTVPWYHLHGLTYLAVVLVAASLCLQYAYLGFGEWLASKTQAPQNSNDKDTIYNMTYLVNGRVNPPTPKAAISKAGSTAHEDHPVVLTILLLLSLLLLVSSATVTELWIRGVEQWKRLRFRMSIIGILVFTTAIAVFLGAVPPSRISSFLRHLTFADAVRLPAIVAVCFVPIAVLFAWHWAWAEVRRDLHF